MEGVGPSSHFLDEGGGWESFFPCLFSSSYLLPRPYIFTHTNINIIIFMFIAFQINVFIKYFIIQQMKEEPEEKGEATTKS